MTDRPTSPLGLPRRAASLLAHGGAQLAEALARLGRLLKLADRTAKDAGATRAAVT